jgi:hypothetical protein
MSPRETLLISAGTTPVLSTTFSGVVLSTGSAPGAILLKKKGASYAIARLPSFDGTDIPCASFVAQEGGRR